ncbi:hypothetical protein Tco_0243073 [Tanacetum coccineum]
MGFGSQKIDDMSCGRGGYVRTDSSVSNATDSHLRGPGNNMLGTVECRSGARAPPPPRPLLVPHPSQHHHHRCQQSDVLIIEFVSFTWQISGMILLWVPLSPPN